MQPQGHPLERGQGAPPQLTLARPPERAQGLWVQVLQTRPAEPQRSAQPGRQMRPPYLSKQGWRLSFQPASEFFFQPIRQRPLHRRRA